MTGRGSRGRRARREAGGGTPLHGGVDSTGLLREAPGHRGGRASAGCGLAAALAAVFEGGERGERRLLARFGSSPSRLSKKNASGC